MNRTLLPFAFTMLLLVGCGTSSPAGVAAASPTSSTPTASADPSPSPSSTPSSTPSSGPTNAPAVHASPTVSASPTSVISTPGPAVGQPEREWAQSARATTSYGTNPGSSWNASQATGAPNASCSDDGRAWASESAGTIDTLTLTYSDHILPSSLRIVQSFNPGRVSKVTVSGGGQTATVYTSPANSSAGGACVTLEIPISTVQFPVDTVAVTVDQTGLGSWAEIDAVELVGIRAA